MKTKAFTLIELLVVVAIIMIFAGLVMGGLGGCSRSEGVRIGTVSKFSYKGNINKSWEGELVMGGLRQGESGAVANIWKFSIIGGKDDALAAKFNALAGKQVKVSYRETAFFNPMRRSTSYIATGVEDLSTAEAK